jgi:hypothetical protein
VEIGTGFNTRFDRVDNGQVHWIDLDPEACFYLAQATQIITASSSGSPARSWSEYARRRPAIQQ